MNIVIQGPLQKLPIDAFDSYQNALLAFNRIASQVDGSKAHHKKCRAALGRLKNECGRLYDRSVRVNSTPAVIDGFSADIFSYLQNENGLNPNCGEIGRISKLETLPASLLHERLVFFGQESGVGGQWNWLKNAGLTFEDDVSHYPDDEMIGMKNGLTASFARTVMELYNAGTYVDDLTICTPGNLHPSKNGKPIGIFSKPDGVTIIVHATGCKINNIKISLERDDVRARIQEALCSKVTKQRQRGKKSVDLATKEDSPNDPFELETMRSDFARKVMSSMLEWAIEHHRKTNEWRFPSSEQGDKSEFFKITFRSLQARAYRLDPLYRGITLAAVAQHYGFPIKKLNSPCPPQLIEIAATRYSLTGELPDHKKIPIPAYNFD